MYLVYMNGVNQSISPICVCKNIVDAEEMCLALHQEDEYDRFFIKLQLNLSREITPIYYNYREVPFVG